MPEKSQIKMKKLKPKYKTEWDFSLFYKKGLKDPAVEKDVQEIEKACRDFSKTYSKKADFLQNDSALAEALESYENLITKIGPAKPLYYLNLLLSVESQNNEAEALMNLLHDRVTKACNGILFFELRLGKIPKNIQDKFLKSPSLKKFHYFLDRLFLSAKYQLSEPEEKILNLKQTTSRGMWIDYSEKLINAQLVLWKGKKIPLSEATGLIPSLPQKERYQLHKILFEKQKEISYFGEAEINAVMTNKKIDDELRSFKKPYESRAISTHLSLETVENVVNVVNKQMKISHKFYKLKARLLGLKIMIYADRAVGIGTSNKKMTFDESVSLFRQSLDQTHHIFRDMFDRLLENGQVDVYPKKGKTGGAFCASGVANPTFVLLNNVDNSHSFLTLAHEMGHAFHSELSKKTQSPIYQDYTISVAEVASTFFENIAFESLVEKVSLKERVVLEFQRLQDDISTIFRQIACFNFELAIHEEVRARGSITKERLAKLHNEKMSEYLGPAVKLTDLDGYMFVPWSHIRNYFYVYTYAYGQIISKALYTKYKKDKTFINSIIKFLGAGGSMSPDDIFKSIGIDTTRPQFFLDGLKEIDRDIDRLEEMARKVGMIK